MLSEAGSTLLVTNGLAVGSVASGIIGGCLWSFPAAWPPDKPGGVDVVPVRDLRSTFQECMCEKKFQKF